ncbi:hypothetical protein JG688_00016228 [Phytophthora aleatoria]|uniref:Ubiquitin-like protease family profile domain-containing protein n=1 Tax=Phytophthora aleatoria TaxID=2496075 RepID=A0A8J5I4L1_9STRA|nr:hypothetical protein JG688_00016228 [Phytophthora aleatoria]
MKNVIMKSFLLDEVISTLMALQEWAEDAYMGESNRVGSRPHIKGEDQEFSALAMQISSHSFEYVKTEYNFAISGDAHYTIDMFGAFKKPKRHVIGCVNLSDAHWVAFHVDASSGVVRMFDPLQKEQTYEKLKTTIILTVESQLKSGKDLTFEQISWCE